MPLNAVGWTTEENELLADLVKPHTCLYSVLDPSRNNILARETTWNEIAQVLNKPAEECRKRWRGLRDGYMRSKRMGALHKTKVRVFEKLQFLDESMENSEDETVVDSKPDLGQLDDEQQVITDKQEYYEITVVGSLEQAQQMKPSSQQMPQPIKILPKPPNLQPIQPERKVRKTPGRKRIIPLPPNLTPVKILPKPIMMSSSPKLLRQVEGPRSEQRSEVIDNLIEKFLKENMNEIDVFFRSMAATVKKLQPNLIPKVKMEVCNVVAKYEMQNFEKNNK